jgi:hypothetical protein
VRLVVRRALDPGARDAQPDRRAGQLLPRWKQQGVVVEPGVAPPRGVPAGPRAGRGRSRRRRRARPPWGRGGARAARGALVPGHGAVQVGHGEMRRAEAQGRGQHGARGGGEGLRGVQCRHCGAPDRGAVWQGRADAWTSRRRAPRPTSPFGRGASRAAPARGGRAGRRRSPLDAHGRGGEEAADRRGLLGAQRAQAEAGVGAGARVRAQRALGVLAREPPPRRQERRALPQLPAPAAEAVAAGRELVHRVAVLGRCGILHPREG